VWINCLAYHLPPGYAKTLIHEFTTSKQKLKSPDNWLSSHGLIYGAAFPPPFYSMGTVVTSPTRREAMGSPTSTSTSPAGVPARCLCHRPAVAPRMPWSGAIGLRLTSRAT
jgi:hypothetical protein